jgi:hypothetical protein
MTVTGLHSCKPGNEPVVGQIKTFTVEQRVAASGKEWTKIKSAPADQGGQPYKILSAKPTGHTDSYGNVSFNLEIEPASTGQTVTKQGGLSHSNGDDRSNRIERQHSQEMALRWYAMAVTVQGAMPAFTMPTTDQLRAMIDWFQRDVGRTPLSPKETEPDEAQPHTIGDGPDDNEEF